MIRDQLRLSLSDALRAAGLPEPPNGVALEPGDPERGQGDWASPVAMQMTKAAKLPPREIADRVCFLDAGRILEDGPPGQVLGDPVEHRTRQFLQRIIEARRI